MVFSIKTINAFEMTGRMLACEVPAKRPGQRAFVGISAVLRSGIFGSGEMEWVVGQSPLVGMAQLVLSVAGKSATIVIARRVHLV